MDTKQLEKFCPWARTELIDAVHLRCTRFGLDDTGRTAHAVGSDIIANTVLAPEQKAQRDVLFAEIEREGLDAFCERQAYRWFNRFAAIRFMEVNGYLTNNVRMFSSTEGAFDPDCLRLASELDLPGLGTSDVLDLIAAGDDEALFRRILVAQMNELAACLPSVFGPVSSADALTLPDNLLGKGEHDVLFHLIEDIPESVWGDVEVLGWMYQFYNAELKDAFFKSKRKASAADIAPATQLFTPDWIVKYMVENSLGRLWMLNNPESGLRAHMDYYIEPDGEHEDCRRISGPEDITFCDPACGSGHILVYAFSLLFEMYAERGYRERDIPELILTKNLSGMEIDERAAQIASLALAMCARGHDRRFLTRGVVADVRVLEPVTFEESALPRALVGKKELVEAMAHLNEIGSLFAPDSTDRAALDTAFAELPAGDIFSQHTREQVERAQTQCSALSRTFDVVVANPPYMGSSSFNPFMSAWMKKNYPDTCKDLCTAFIERGYSLAKANGYSAMVTMQSWMFLGSFEKMRNNLIDSRSIVTMAHLGPRAFDAIGGEVVSVTASVIYNGKSNNTGAYFRLVDIIGSEPKREKLLEAIQNPSCGWFYRADATTFHDIPGSPIAYWASKGLLNAFSGRTIAEKLPVKKGLDTGNNELFLRLWHEVSWQKIGIGYQSSQYFTEAKKKWAPHDKGGDFRRWFGNNDWVIDWRNNGEALKASTANLRSERFYFKQAITWSSLTSGSPSFRLANQGSISNTAGSSLFPDVIDVWLVIAFMNSSFVALVLQLLSPTLNYSAGPVGNCPEPPVTQKREHIEGLAKQCVFVSKTDWDSQETSWEFKRNPLI